MSNQTKEVSESVKKFNEIYNDEKSKGEDGKLTKGACEAIEKLDFTKFSIEDMEVITKSDKLPDDLAVKILKDWMRRQDSLISNIRGKIAYSPEVSKNNLEDFVNMMRCPTENCNERLVVNDILRNIATGGGLRPIDSVSLIDPKDFDNGIIRFDQSSSNKNKPEEAPFLLDFKPDTYYHNVTPQNPFFILGLPPFMKAKLTSYKLFPPSVANSGPKNWILYGSNDWTNIRNGNPHQIDKQSNNNDLKDTNEAKEFFVNSDDNQYYRYFKFESTGENLARNNEINLGGIDFSGNIVICQE